jgi:hypothetical protein
MRKLLGFLALATCAAAPAAATVTYDFAGVLDSSFGAYSAGDTFTGSFTYDETVAANAGSSSVTAVFNALAALNVTVNTTSGPSALTAYDGELQMGNQGTNGVDTETTDRFAVVSLVTGSTIASTTPQAFILRLDDSTGNIFSSALTLPTALNLADFDVNLDFLFASLPDSDPDAATGHLTSLTAAAVPEPASWGLMLVGFGLAGGAIRSTRHSAIVTA